MEHLSQALTAMYYDKAEGWQRAIRTEVERTFREAIQRFQVTRFLAAISS